MVWKYLGDEDLQAMALQMEVTRFIGTLSLAGYDINQILGVVFDLWNNDKQGKAGEMFQALTKRADFTDKVYNAVVWIILDLAEKQFSEGKIAEFVDFTTKHWSVKI